MAPAESTRRVRPEKRAASISPHAAKERQIGMPIALGFSRYSHYPFNLLSRH
jgi:hypothetical protein